VNPRAAHEPRQHKRRSTLIPAPGTQANTGVAPSGTGLRGFDLHRIDLHRIDVRQAGLIAVLLLLAAAGWVFTADRMSGMDMGGWTDPGALDFFLATWVVMLAAMMFPSVAPMVTAYAKISRRRRETGRHAPRGSTALFVAGYLLAWTAFGLVAYGLYEAVASLVPGGLTADPGGRYAAAGVILAAAVYQLTPAKNVCLTKCRSPLDFILHRLRPGYGGALRMGIEHGAWCVGCCWALMVAVFALGVMSVGWMALVGAFIAVEKMLPWKRLANRSVAAALAIIALTVALTPTATGGMGM
jgi:predicted metal-binding membrane protein